MIPVLLVLLSMEPVRSAGATPERVALAVRIHVDPAVDRGDVERAQEVAQRLLAAAGIDMTWRICPPGGCDSSTYAAGEIFVILTNRALSGRDENCGRAAVGAGVAEGTIRVSLSCIQGVVSRLMVVHRSRGAIHPLLLIFRHYDLVGAVEAHEIGHVLGLRHGNGVMRADLDPDDVVALRRGMLAFSAPDAARMRAALSRAAGLHGSMR